MNNNSVLCKFKCYNIPAHKLNMTLLTEKWYITTVCNILTLMFLQEKDPKLCLIGRNRMAVPH